MEGRAQTYGDGHWLHKHGRGTDWRPLQGIQVAREGGGGEVERERIHKLVDIIHR